jgi:hypothetical protein
MAKPIQISGEIDFEKLLKQLSDDIITAPVFLRMDNQLSEHFEKYSDEVNQAAFFWSMVAIAVRETGRSRLARIYDKQKSALSLRKLLVTIEANKHLFDDSAVEKRVQPVDPSFAQNIVPGSHFPNSKTLEQDLALVSPGDPLVDKVLIWRNNFGAHISPSQTIQKTILDEELPTQDEAFNLCKRAFDIFNRYSSLFRNDSISEVNLGEKGSIDSVFRHLRSGLAAGRKARDEAAEQLLKAMKIESQA